MQENHGFCSFVWIVTLIHVCGSREDNGWRRSEEGRGGWRDSRREDTDRRGNRDDPGGERDDRPRDRARCDDPQKAPPREPNDGKPSVCLYSHHITRVSDIF